MFVYVIAIAAWVMLALVSTREKNRLAVLEKLPRNERTRVVTNLPEGTTPEQAIRRQIHGYIFVVVLVLVGLVAFVVTLALSVPPHGPTPAEVLKTLKLNEEADAS